jgi:hypothetical protein
MIGPRSPQQTQGTDAIDDRKTGAMCLLGVFFMRLGSSK